MQGFEPTAIDGPQNLRGAVSAVLDYPERREMAPAQPHPEPSQLSEVALYTTLRAWFRQDAAHANDWRKDARFAFGFAASDQWDPADRAILESGGRVPVTFNRTLAIIKSVAGIEINGRHDIAFLPRSTDVAAAEFNELLSEASRWMADGCDAEDEQSDAFQDCTICGMGWTEARLDFESDPEGCYVETRVDPLEMYWDANARAKNLTDARRVWRVRKMTIQEARELAPGVPDYELDAPWAIGASEDSQPTRTVEERRIRDQESDAAEHDFRNEVHVVQVQWWERETYWRVAVEGQPGPASEMTPEQFRRARDRYTALGQPIVAMELKRRVYKQAFLGRSILNGVRPAPVEDRFTFNCITGERDRNAGTWYGLVRLMRDPQMWANKWLSQSLHILNTTAKGGILAEEDAFPDQREAEETYAQADAITWVRQGAIQKGKITQKPGAGIPTPYINLLQFAIGSIRDVVGINLELLGMRDVSQPGILEAQRKQAAMTILATLFDSLRRFRKGVGRCRLYMIQNYLSDGRWIRVTGKDGIKFTQLLRDKTMGQYDVIVDDAPTSPNQKEKSWAVIQMLLPSLRNMLTPEILLLILEYSPLPAALIEALKKMAQEPKPEEQQQKQLALAAAGAELQDKQATAALTAARAKREAAGLAADAAGAERDRAAAAGARAKTILDFASAASQASQSMLDAAKADYVRSRSPQPESGRQNLSSDQLLESLLNGAEQPESSGAGYPPTSGSLPQVPGLPTLSQGGMPPTEIYAPETGGSLPGALLSNIPAGPGAVPAQ